jgi:hypothetical protein
MTESNKGPRCPVCSAVSKPRTENTAYPFCSKRCRTIDLGSWLDERYRFADSESDRPPADPDARETWH